MAKNKNFNIFTPFLIAAKDNANLVTIIIGGKRYPTKAYKPSSWYLVFEDDYIEVVEEKRKEILSIKKTAKFGIEKAELGVIRRTAFGVSYGMYLTNLRLELYLKYEKGSIVVICDALSIAKELFQWFEKNEIPVIDPLDIRDLVNKDLDKPLQEYLKEKLMNTSNEKYKRVYSNIKRI